MVVFGEKYPVWTGGPFNNHKYIFNSKHYISLGCRRNWKQNHNFRKMIPERSRNITSTFTRRISKRANIPKNRTLVVYILNLNYIRFTVLYLSFICSLISLNEGRRWLRFIKLQLYCTMCSEQLFLLQKLMQMYVLQQFPFTEHLNKAKPDIKYNISMYIDVAFTDPKIC